MLSFSEQNGCKNTKVSKWETTKTVEGFTRSSPGLTPPTQTNVQTSLGGSSAPIQTPSGVSDLRCYQASPLTPP